MATADSPLTSAADALDDVEAELSAAERAGLKIGIKGRNLALLPIAAWFGIAGNYPGYLYALLALAGFLALGLLQLRLIGSRLDRPWHRYAFLTVDIAALGLMAALMPLSTGGEVPQIIALRAYGVYYLFLVLGVATLSLSPGLVLWAGGATVVALWTAFAWIVSGMERIVSWGDLPPSPTAQAYLDVFLDPDFVGIGNRITETVFVLLTAAVLAVAVKRAREVVRSHARAERQRARVQQVFGRYVPGEVAGALLSDGGTLAAQTRVASVLFVDIEGFTKFAEGQDPERVIAVLNAYFDGVAKTIGAEGGVVISFIGDAVLAAFNLPLPQPDFAARALAAGQALLDLAARETFEGEALRIRVGIATGPVAAGSVGGGGRQTYTVYGDTVNLAQRLEAKNKELGSHLLVCAETRAACPTVALREVGEVPIRGRSEAVRAFAPAQVERERAAAAN